MENNYQIIDEPKRSQKEHLIINPLVILFAAILVPLFWSPPALGKLWMPLIWIVANGYFLGSATLKKECLICIGGGLVMLAFIFAVGVYSRIDVAPIAFSTLIPYINIMLNAILFMTLYFAIFTQTTSFELYQYMKENRS